MWKIRRKWKKVIRLIDVEEMIKNKELLLGGVEAAVAASPNPGRALQTIEIIAVSKYHSVEAILQANNLGFEHFGENRVQELCEKLDDPRLNGISFDLIGTLQTNKVKDVVGKVRLIHSLDRKSLLDALEKRAEQLSLVQDVLIQVNYSAETSKHGLDVQELPSFISQAARCKHLRVRGLMTMAAPGIDLEQQNLFFRSFKVLFDKTGAELPQGIERSTFNVLSMGMSDDFEAAIRAGSNCIRVGRAIFGERSISKQA